MKVIQVAPGIGDEAAGPSYSVPRLCDGLFTSGCEVELHFLDSMPKRTFNYPISCYPLHNFPLRQLGRSPEMLKGLIQACATADIIHNNSFWMYPNVYPVRVIQSLPKGVRPKLVNAPRGTFSPWALSHHCLKKKLFGWLGGQYLAMSATDMWHATCEKEYEEIRAQGYKQPVAIVPIGMDLPELEKKPQNTEGASPQLPVASCQLPVGATAQDEQLQVQNSELKKIVFFGRVHKVKAVDHLVRAWGALHADLPEWELVIAGPDCGAQDELEAIIATEKIPRVRFVGEINGPVKYDFLTEADIYVLPSYTENFGITVAEALACGTPTIASQGTPWEGLETEQCGKWVQIGVEPLVEALRELTSLTDDERAEMGERGRAWIQRDFSWDGIGAKMKAAYEWLLGQGEKPDFVRVD